MVKSVERNFYTYDKRVISRLLRGHEPRRLGSTALCAIVFVKLLERYWLGSHQT